MVVHFTIANGNEYFWIFNWYKLYANFYGIKNTYTNRNFHLENYRKNKAETTSLLLRRYVGPLVKGCRFGFRADLQYEIIIFRTTFAGEGTRARVREELTTTPKWTAKTNVRNLARFCNAIGGNWPTKIVFTDFFARHYRISHGEPSHLYENRQRHLSDNRKSIWLISKIN